MESCDNLGGLVFVSVKLGRFFLGAGFWKGWPKVCVLLGNFYFCKVVLEWDLGLSWSGYLLLFLGFLEYSGKIKGNCALKLRFWEADLCNLGLFHRGMWIIVLFSRIWASGVGDFGFLIEKLLWFSYPGAVESALP